MKEGKLNHCKYLLILIFLGLLCYHMLYEHKPPCSQQNFEFNNYLKNEPLHNCGCPRTVNHGNIDYILQSTCSKVSLILLFSVSVH